MTDELKCDFCSSRGIVAAYDAADFVTAHTRFIEGHSKGGWAACAECAFLIDTGQKVALANRSYDTFFTADPQTQRLDRQQRRKLKREIQRFHDGFWKHRILHPTEPTKIGAVKFKLVDGSHREQAGYDA